MIESGVNCHRVDRWRPGFQRQSARRRRRGNGHRAHRARLRRRRPQTRAEHGIVGIAPLGEDGTFVEGFGDFTGREAIDPDTADLVFEKLKEKHLLVAVEDYPHIYPHCWRTGDELVFRLVDEWFINMDWREEIKEVTEDIRWLPESIDGQEPRTRMADQHAGLDDLQKTLLGTGAADLDRSRKPATSKSSARWRN